jgi:hypothetical protein
MHRKQLLLIAILNMLSLLNVNAQEALCSWLSASYYEPGRQMLFRRTYAANFDMTEAHIAIASKGTFRLFVNGRAVFSSYISGNSRHFYDDCDIYNIDVKAYIRNGSNTIAVWYAPEFTAPEKVDMTGEKMIALCFYGVDASGKSFLHTSDSTWLCAPSNTLSTTEGEIVNALEYIPDWNICDLPMPMKWNCAEDAGSLRVIMSDYPVYEGFADSRIDIINPRHFDVSENEKTVIYDFDKGFFGTFRFTVRGAAVGERIWANGSEYVCRGVLDEQFIGRFVHKSIRKIIITGDDSFRKSHVVKVEGMALSY